MEANQLLGHSLHIWHLDSLVGAKCRLEATGSCRLVYLPKIKTWRVQRIPPLAWRSSTEAGYLPGTWVAGSPEKMGAPLGCEGVDLGAWETQAEK